MATREAAKNTKISLADLTPQPTTGAIKQYQKIPEAAEAVQFLGWQNAPDIFGWMPNMMFVPRGYEHHLRTEQEFDSSKGQILPDAPEFLVFKSDQDYRIDLWTWIVRTEKGQVYFYSEEGFRENYQDRVA